MELGIWGLVLWGLSLGFRSLECGILRIQGFANLAFQSFRARVGFSGLSG